LGLIDNERVRSAAALVRRGEVVPLNWSVDLPHPAILGRRSCRHRVIQGKDALDDAYDDYFPQGSSQWDSLCHISHPELGVYNGLGQLGDAASVDSIRRELGIHRWARRGIVGRFTLADVAGYEAAHGHPIDCATDDAVAVDRVVASLDAVGAGVEVGDILLVRFGWTEWYEKLQPEARGKLAAKDMFAAPGLARSRDVLEWLWDSGVAAIATDTPAVEVMPFDAGRSDGFLHYELIPLLGFALGELFALSGLAQACAKEGRYCGLLVASPMNMTGGVGSPANAIAII
jgi:kynurenine formamidase